MHHPLSSNSKGMTANDDGKNKDHRLSVLSKSSTSVSKTRSSFRRQSQTITSELFEDILVSSEQPKPLPPNPTLEGLTINKLRISSLGIYGRESQFEALRRCFDRVKVDSNSSTTTTTTTTTKSCSNNREVVWIKGNSGTGKSALCESFGKIVKQQNGTYVSGKFDYCLREEPYSGMIQACQELCRLVMEKCDNDPDKDNNRLLLEEIRLPLLDRLGNEVGLLTDLIPGLKLLLGKEYHHHHHHPQRQNDADFFLGSSPEAKSQQVNYAFRIFVRLMSKMFEPLVIVLDDLQFADSASLDLIEILSTDQQNLHGLMMIGCYRPNEIDGNHRLSKVIQAIKERDPTNCRTTEVDVEDLGIRECNQMLMTLLSIDNEERTIHLAKLCRERTLGNPFFIIQFTVMLQEGKFLEFNLGTLEWTWDEAYIEEMTTVSDNVIDIVKERMTKLPKYLRLFLELAALIGSMFSHVVIEKAWEKLSVDNVDAENSEKDTTVRSMIDMAIEAKFIERSGVFVYRWLHDKIQEAAIQLIPDLDMAKSKFNIGMTLASELSKDQLDLEIFVVANLLKDVSDNQLRPGDRCVVFQLLLQAAEKAKSFSAYQSAASYAKSGILLLPEDSWDSHFDETLCLYSIGAESYGFLGECEEMQAYSEEVLRQAKCTIFDKLRIYYVLIDSYGNGGRQLDALDISFSVLGELGCNFPRHPIRQAIQAGSSLLKMKRNPPRTEDIMNLSLTTDRKKQEVIKLLSRTAALLYYTQNWPLYILGKIRTIPWTMKYGLTDSCSTAFSGLALIIVGMLDDFENGTAFLDAGILCNKRYVQHYSQRSRETSRLCFMAAAIGSWTKAPIPSIMRSLPDGYKIGMQLGNTESAMWCCAHHIFLQLIGGGPLNKLDVDCRTYTTQMKDLNRQEHLQFTNPIWQVALNLMGRSKSFTSLAGEAFGDDMEEADVFSAANGSYKTSLRNLELAKNALYTYFGEYQKGADLAITRGRSYLKDMPCVPGGMWDMFLRGICLFNVARTTRLSKYKKHALKARRAIRSWLQRGNPNVGHQSSLLDAEYYFLKRNIDKASKCYEDAISKATRGGFIHDAAMANERYAQFLLGDGLDTEGAVFYLHESLRLYSEWGATAKVVALREEHKGLLR